MPYPKQFPYDLLDASPADDTPGLQKRYGQAMVKRRDQIMAVRHAFDELRNPRTRLGYDILLITDVAAPADVSELLVPLGNPTYLPDRIEPPVITLALTALAGDQAAFCRPVKARPTPITGSKKLEALPDDVLRPSFDR